MPPRKTGATQQSLTSRLNAAPSISVEAPDMSTTTLRHQRPPCRLCAPGVRFRCLAGPRSWARGRASAVRDAAFSGSRPRPRSTDRELTMDCRHCGNARDDARETVPYVGPATRGGVARHARHALSRVRPHDGRSPRAVAPRYAHSVSRGGNRRAVTAAGLREGHWCLLPRPPGATGATAPAS